MSSPSTFGAASTLETDTLGVKTGGTLAANPGERDKSRRQRYDRTVRPARCKQAARRTNERKEGTGPAQPARTAITGMRRFVCPDPPGALQRVKFLTETRQGRTSTRTPLPAR